MYLAQLDVSKVPFHEQGTFRNLAPKWVHISDQELLELNTGSAMFGPCKAAVVVSFGDTALLLRYQKAQAGQAKLQPEDRARRGHRGY